MWTRRISTKWGFLLVVAVAFGVAVYLVVASRQTVNEIERDVVQDLPSLVSHVAQLSKGALPGDVEPRSIVLPPPPPIDRIKLRERGCVADGLLNNYGNDEKNSVAMVNRSECYYFHRAFETWLAAPDFKKAHKIMKKITRPNTVYGMFLAEAISTKARYTDPVDGEEYHFSKMCRGGSKNFWGEHTCKPSLSSTEYQRYLGSITERAMDMGIQVFMFGQVYLQDTKDLSESKLPQIMERMREYAAGRGMDIMIGAQTNDITDETYLRRFDFIENGVGIDGMGNIESGPCHSRWYSEPGDWCWGLLWHPNYSSKANGVFIHLDWSGRIGDDMSVFTRMTKERREETLESLHNYFTTRGMAFLLPLMGRLHRDNGGCYGDSKHFYSASREYSCQDEDAINRILAPKVR